VSVILCRSDDLHPYECSGVGVCAHCDRLPSAEHNPATCALCDPEYDYAPNPFRPEQAATTGEDAQATEGTGSS
jgi:hypothetical protein